MIVVIPSIRNINHKFISPLLHKDNRFIVVDDSGEAKIKSDNPQIEIFTYEDRKRILGKHEHCIPRKNGACRDLGLLIAYLESDEDEIIVCLDDDCEVYEDYEHKAKNSLGRKNLPLLSTSHEFFNPLSIYKIDEDIYPRGFPYEHRGKEYDYEIQNNADVNIVFNLGLWNGIFDINAIDKLYLDKYAFDDAQLKYDQIAVNPGPLVSLCSMNMIFKKELIPAIYQLPMNIPIIPNWTIDRYGDIWGGFICKKLIDRKGDYLSVGAPLIYHHKADNITKNILQEHYSHIVNLKFCEFIERACEDISPAPYIVMYENLVSNIFDLENSYPAELKTYLFDLRDKMLAWVISLRG